MLNSNDWRFVNDGNAHVVYRYIGPPSDYFTGMVLKLPKDSSHDDRRLFHQHKFVQGLVVGDESYSTQQQDHSHHPHHPHPHHLHHPHHHHLNNDHLYTVSEIHRTRVSFNPPICDSLSPSDCPHDVQDIRTTAVVTNVDPEVNRRRDTTYAQFPLFHSLHGYDPMNGNQTQWSNADTSNDGSPRSNDSNESRMEGCITTAFHPGADDDCCCAHAPGMASERNHFEPIQASRIYRHHRRMSDPKNSMQHRMDSFSNFHHSHPRSYSPSPCFQYGLPSDRGLVSPIYLPSQQLHLFEDKQTVKLREQVPQLGHPRCKDTTTASVFRHARPLPLVQSTISNATSTSSSSSRRSAPFTLPLRSLCSAPLVHAQQHDLQSSPILCPKPVIISHHPIVVPPRHCMSSSTLRVSSSACPSSLSSSCSPSGLVAPPPSPVSHGTPRFSFALLERDLVTPPMDPSRLLSVNAYDHHCWTCLDERNGSFEETRGSMDRSDEEEEDTEMMECGEWIYLTCELKPKTGLPAFVYPQDWLSSSTDCSYGSKCHSTDRLSNHTTTSSCPSTAQSEDSRFSMNFIPTLPGTSTPECSLSTPSISQAHCPPPLTVPSADSPSPLPRPLGGSFYHVSRFTMQQYLKLTKKIVKQRSHYSPELLFGRLSSQNNIAQQLRALLKQPQNNFRLFIDGARIYWTDDQYRSSDSSHPLSLLSSSVGTATGTAAGTTTTSILQDRFLRFSPSCLRRDSLSFDASAPAASHIHEDHNDSFTVTRTVPKNECAVVEPSLLHINSYYDLFPEWSCSSVMRESSVDTLSNQDEKEKREANLGPRHFNGGINGNNLLHSDSCNLDSKTSFEYLRRYGNPIVPLVLSLPTTQQLMSRCASTPGNHRQERLTKTDDSISELNGDGIDEIRARTVLKIRQRARRKTATGSPAPRLMGDSRITSPMPSLQKDDQKRKLFHSSFPVEVDARFNKQQEESAAMRTALEAWGDLISEVLAIEKHLFHRLLYIHALCEGQQHVAAELLEQLKGIGWLRSPMSEGNGDSKEQHASSTRVEAGESGYHTSRQDIDSELINRLIDEKLTPHSNNSECLKEFLVEMEADIAKNGDQWALNQTDGANSAANGTDAEALLAVNVQLWHYAKGQKLIDAGKTFIATQKEKSFQERAKEKEFCCFPEEHLQRVTHWIYRYLIGRTFLDCSLMINLAIGIECANSCEDCNLSENRFVKLATVPLKSILVDTHRNNHGLATPKPIDSRERGKCDSEDTKPRYHLGGGDNGHGEDGNPIQSAFRSLRIPVSRMTRPQLPHPSRPPSSMLDGVNQQQTATERHDWYSLHQLIAMAHCRKRSMRKSSRTGARVSSYRTSRDHQQHREDMVSGSVQPLGCRPDTDHHQMRTRGVPNHHLGHGSHPTSCCSSTARLMVESESLSLSLWYRLSVVDLDLKQPSKIPSWSHQLTHILQAFNDSQRSKTGCQANEG